MKNVRGKVHVQQQDPANRRTVALIAAAGVGVMVTLLGSSAAHLLG